MQLALSRRTLSRFETMNMMRHTKTLGIIEIDGDVWSRLTNSDKQWIESICEEKLEKYYERLSKKSVE